MIKDNILFLDIDGVLNTRNTFYRRNKFYKNNKIVLPKIDEFRVELLSRIIKETNSSIVISSSWRNGLEKKDDTIIPCNEDCHDLILILKKYDLVIDDITPFDQNRIRQNEIREYLNNHNVKKFVIIDDEDADLFEYKDELVKIKCDWQSFDINSNGLNESYVEIIKEKLTKNKIRSKK